MKAVIYHADAKYGDRWGDGVYKHLVEELKKNVNSFGIDLIHLTAKGHPGWGDQNIEFDLENVEQVIYNREKTLLDFLGMWAEEDETYWFIEPDFRMLKHFPPLHTDLAMLIRDDPMRMTPAWRLAKKSALPVFEEAFDNFDLENKVWHGDSPSWNHFWRLLGSPTEPGDYEWNGVNVELRTYGHYASRNKCLYSKQCKGGSKHLLFTDEFKEQLKQKEGK